mgnify:CR=1 FL=1
MSLRNITAGEYTVRLMAELKRVLQPDIRKMQIILVQYILRQQRYITDCVTDINMKQSGREKGRKMVCIESGYEFGLTEEDILTRLQKKLNKSLQKAQEYLVMFRKQTM